MKEHIKCAMRELWRSAGGRFHGPHIETGTMPENTLLPFLAMLVGRAESAEAELAKMRERAEKAEAELQKLREQKPFCFATPVETMGHDWKRAVFFSERNEVWKATVPLYAAPVAAPAVPAPSVPYACLNTWFLSLPDGRQAILREDKWMLANAAFEAGRALLQSAEVRHD